MGVFKLALLQDNGNFTIAEMIESTKKLTFEGFTKFCNTFYSKIWIEVLIAGNMTLETAENIVKEVENGFSKFRPNLKTLPVCKIPSLRIVDLPENKTWINEYKLEKTEQFEQKNSSIDMTFQYGYSDLR